MPATRKHILNIRRIVAGALVLICVGINLLAAVYVRRQHKLIEDAISATTSEHGRAWAQLCKERMLAGDDTGLQNVIEAIGRSESVQLAMVTGEEGKVLAATDPQRIGEHHQVEHDGLTTDEPHVEELHPKPTGFFHESGHTFEFCFPIEEVEERLGRLIVHVNTAWGNQQAKALALKWMLLLLVFTMFVGIAAVGLDRRLRRAVQTLISATEAIARGERDPDLRVGTGDELDLLGDSVRHMASALQDTEDRVKHWHRQLETTIAERTIQLEESHQLLAEREKMAALGLMAAGIVHEVGNPLAAMAAIVQRIERQADPKLAEKCKTLRQQIERISKIVDEMRQVARPVSPDDTFTNANETLNVAIKIARYDPRAKASRIVADLDADIPRIAGHPDRWQQVFLNLIINALDAMPDGGRITVSSSYVDGCVEIAFADTGRGMDPEQLGRLYHPFYTTKARGGMGLGLSVCYGIVRGCGGDIRVASELGKGTVVRIVVPLPDRASYAGTSGKPEGSAAQRAR